MKTVVHNKLVRDNIPEIIEAAGKTCKTRILDDQEYNECLKAKLLEEGNEVVSAEDTVKLTKEIADVLEVLDALMKCNDITLEQVLQVKAKKASKNGAFEKKIYLEEVYDDRG